MGLQLASPFAHCAYEGQLCLFSPSKAQNVAFGINDNYHFRDVIDSSNIMCTNNNFEFPKNGSTIRNQCLTRDIPKYSFNTDGTPFEFTECSVEGTICSSPYDSDILYGADGKYLSGYIKANQTIKCDSKTFGDPKTGKQNICYIRNPDFITSLVTQANTMPVVPVPANMVPVPANMVPVPANIVPIHANVPPEPIYITPPTINVKPPPINIIPNSINVQPTRINIQPTTITIEPPKINVQPNLINTEPKSEHFSQISSTNTGNIAKNIILNLKNIIGKTNNSSTNAINGFDSNDKMHYYL